MQADRYQDRAKNQSNSLKIGVIVGVVWTVVQFGICEGLYRLGNETGADVLYDMSDLAAWPAGLLYYEAEKELYAEQLAALEGTTEEKERWNELLLRMENPEDDAAYDALWEVFSSKSVEPVVDMKTEYSIYFGVCAVWGIMIATLISTAHFLRKGI